MWILDRVGGFCAKIFVLDKLILAHGLNNGHNLVLVPPSRPAQKSTAHHAAPDVSVFSRLDQYMCLSNYSCSCTSDRCSAEARTSSSQDTIQHIPDPYITTGTLPMQPLVALRAAIYDLPDFALASARLPSMLRPLSSNSSHLDFPQLKRYSRRWIHVTMAAYSTNKET